MAASVDMTGKTVIVTGCNTGLGKQTAKELARKGARVIMACRNEERTEPARQEIISETNNSNVIFMKLDLGSLETVRNFAAEFNTKEDRLDLLVNNAGILTTERQLTTDGHEMMLGVNHLGHFLLTNLLLDKLKASAPSRIVVLASLAHEQNPIKMEDLESEKGFSVLGTYGRSKTANVLFATHLAKLLEDTGVTVYSLHPGVIKTDLARDSSLSTNCCFWLCFRCIAFCFMCDPMKDMEEGAATTLYCCMEPSIAEHTGRYYSDCKEKKAKSYATDPATALELWERSCVMCGL